MKNNNKLSAIFAAIAALSFSQVQAGMISFELNPSWNYQRTSELTIDGQHTDDTNGQPIAADVFSSEITFDLFSPSNLALEQQEHFFEDNGYDLGWWMTVFNFTPQQIFTPFADELLAMVNVNDYEHLNDNYMIFAAGSYHYHNPEDDTDVVESIEFRRELFGYTLTEDADGITHNSFTYWQQFTVHLPSPLSLDNKSYFDSYTTEQKLAQYSGSSVTFNTYLSKYSGWNNHDHSEVTYNITDTGYNGNGVYQYQNILQVSAPVGFGLILPLMLVGFCLRKKKSV